MQIKNNRTQNIKDQKMNYKVLMITTLFFTAQLHSSSVVTRMRQLITTTSVAGSRFAGSACDVRALVRARTPMSFHQSIVDRDCQSCDGIVCAGCTQEGLYKKLWDLKKLRKKTRKRH